MSRRLSDEFMDGELVFDNGTLKPFTHMKEYRKKQFSELESKLNENEEHHALITLEEAAGFLKSYLCKDGEHKAWKDKVFACTDPASSFFGNMLESIGLVKVINEFKSLGVKAREYKVKGVTYIKITGKESVRKFITGSDYRIDNPKILKIGIGSKGIVNGILGGIKHSIYFSLAYRAIEWIMKDEYALADFLGNVTVDVAKLAITILATLVIGKVVTAPLLAIGASIVGISVGLFVLGLAIAAILYALDNDYGITNKVVENLRKKKILIG
ncbi:hypothetical protein [Xenorhabdus miraniensis]|uniref:Inner membrane protein yafU n=1 Tax=Xenorhabdus miraniensis TaxID=351674 RepID=A0A2D0JS15_9GAMM|nr:hypothetical protein [Xenorhabdus miraniensis]PHM49078.1 hypothetical protein Xmir_01863 [Xenorhabdus miraniensis]